MTKTIRVSGCHDCDNKLIYHSYWHCNSDKIREPINITSNYINKTLHDDCPLEDDRSRLIKKLETRIHRQRLALRENWETVESRQKHRKTPLRTMWFDMAISLGKENSNLRKRLGLKLK